MSKKIMIAMSGGVDSSVAALLLKEEGFDVVGVTMCFSAGESRRDLASGGNLPAGNKKRPSCCGLEGIEDAKRVAQQLSIPHYVLNFGKHLQDNVVVDFVTEYANGRTPNPCVRCNQYLKFGGLLKKATSLGIDYLATGHFARIEKRQRTYLLKKGVDKHKDQSYFLCQTHPRQLSRILFPLGALTKQEVREIAKKRGLYVAQKPASQEVCFIADNDYRAFLKDRLDKRYFRKGDIVDKNGRVLGTHDGIYNFTIGQREGLGISAPTALYVTALDSLLNKVIVGEKADVYSKSLVASELNILAKGILRKSATVRAKIRYNHPEGKAKIKLLSKDKVRVDFSEPQPAITPGQFVVFYKDDIVLGGAKILERVN